MESGRQGRKWVKEAIRIEEARETMEGLECQDKKLWSHLSLSKKRTSHSSKEWRRQGGPGGQ